jgi:hypothetical protein
LIQIGKAAAAETDSVALNALIDLPFGLWYSGFVEIVESVVAAVEHYPKKNTSLIIKINIYCNHFYFLLSFSHL